MAPEPTPKPAEFTIISFTLFIINEVCLKLDFRPDHLDINYHQIHLHSRN
jgi:hypothetical protein